MNNHLVILGHPSSENLNKVIFDELTYLYEKYSQQVVLRDLYETGFNPILTKEDMATVKTGVIMSDVAIEQEYVRNADVITFIYPIWWTGMPAIIKGYIDRVFSYGFAYSVDENGTINKLLKDKKIVIVNTLGKPASFNLRGGVYDSMNLLTENHIFEFCGMDIIVHYYMDNIGESEDIEVFKTKISDLKREIKKSLFLKNNSRLSIPNSFY